MKDRNDKYIDRCKIRLLPKGNNPGMFYRLLKTLNGNNWKNVTYLKTCKATSINM